MASLEPIHSDRYRGSLLDFVSPAIAGALVIMGLLGGDPVGVALGVALAIFIWFTRHARYDIFPDRLVIRYWGPRQKVLPLTEIEDVHLVRMPRGGGSLLVRKRGGGGLLTRPTDPELFLARLEAARRGSPG